MVDRWRRQSSMPNTAHQSSSSLSVPNFEPVATTKTPRSLTKALRSISSSSNDSVSVGPSRSSGSQRHLHKTPAAAANTSASMIGRLHRRVSRESSTASPVESCSTHLSNVAHSSMNIAKCSTLKNDSFTRKSRSDYIVLTDHCISRFASFEAALVTYPQITSHHEPSLARSASPSSASSKASTAESRLDIPLLAIVAAYVDVNAATAHSLDLWWSSPPPKLAYFRLHFSFNTAHERDEWLTLLHRVSRHKLRQTSPFNVVPDNVRARIQHIVRSTEAIAEHVPCKVTIFPAVRPLTSSPKSAADDSAASADGASPLYLAVGPFMCYLVEMRRSDYATPPTDLKVKVLSFGTVTLSRFQASIATHQQTFAMTFRLPFEKETRLTLASAHYRRIIENVMKTDRVLRPTWPQHLQQATFDIHGLAAPLQLTSGNDLGGLDVSLPAYCAAYQVSVPNWKIDWNTPSPPCFCLLPPPPQDQQYTALQLLAVFRALRYNSFFKAVSFANIDLSPLAGKHDLVHYDDTVVFTSANRVHVPEDLYGIMSHASVLEQEIHSLLFASDSIRSINLSNVVGRYDYKMRQRNANSASPPMETMTSQLLRPILELVKRQLSHCHSISLCFNPMSAEDADELRYTLSLQHVRLKSLELSACGIADFGLSDIWTALENQADTLEIINLSNNQGTVPFETISNTLSRLGTVTKLYIAHSVRLAKERSLFDDVTLASWHLQELDLSGLMLNDATVESLAGYLSRSSSQSLRLVRLDYCGLNGFQMARLFRSMGADRDMEVNMSSCRIDDGIAELCQVFGEGLGPRCLLLRMIDFAREESFVRLLRALTVNTSIKCLSLAGSSTPDSASETACQAVYDLLAKNQSIRYLDMSGYDSKLDEGRLGRGFARALAGVGHNTSIEHLRVRGQMLDTNVGDFAEALAVNKTLRTVDCERNDLTLSNLRYLVGKLESNTTLRNFSAFTSQELERAIAKMGQNQNPTPAKRPSFMSRLRHDNNGPSQQDMTLVQELKGEWMQAIHHLRSIMDRNLGNHVQTMTSETASPSVMSRLSFSVNDGVFAAAFGGLALKDYEGLKSVITSQNVEVSQPVSMHTRTSSSRSATTGEEPSSVYSEAAASPYSEAGTSELGAAPPLDRKLLETGTAVPREQQQQLPLDPPNSAEAEAESESALLKEMELWSIIGDSNDVHDGCVEGQEVDSWIQINRYRRYQGDPTNRIEEEDHGHETNRVSM